MAIINVGTSILGMVAPGGPDMDRWLSKPRTILCKGFG